MNRLPDYSLYIGDRAILLALALGRIFNLFELGKFYIVVQNLCARHNASDDYCSDKMILLVFVIFFAEFCCFLFDVCRRKK